MEFPDEVRQKIVKFRRAKTQTGKIESYRELSSFLHEDLSLLELLSTRWLVSICDSIFDGEKGLVGAKALMLSVFINTIKLGETRLRMAQDENPNENRVVELQMGNVPLWDGMTTFVPMSPYGDMTWNLFRRMRESVSDHPILRKIFEILIDRLKNSDNLLSDLNEYHGQIFKTATQNNTTR